MKRATEPPWMPAPDYAKTLSGLGINLLVREIAPAAAFAGAVLTARVIHADADFAVLRHGSAEWMLHADHTYQDHPLQGSLNEDIVRGVGAELRLYGRDPDAAEAAAREHGHTVLEGATDKPHGLREVYILDPDGYLWVPGVSL